MGFFLPVGIYMHPMLAGAAMAFSSVSVVTSSLTLKWWVRPADSVMPDEAHDGGAGWTGMIGDVVGSAWDSLKGLVRGDNAAKSGYSQLPVEMSSTTP
ncbi:Cu(2+)-transporting P-type ATPase [Paramarasmius palmivorus]|uniref:Cu(2+)-transporting P-type ATPase n=1 Tax=Paramarasmius palmivorus TaxID=297713 RepID=A0AAW0EA79_9AGAR